MAFGVTNNPGRLPEWTTEGRIYAPFSPNEVESLETVNCAVDKDIEDIETEVETPLMVIADAKPGEEFSVTVKCEDRKTRTGSLRLSEVVEEAAEEVINEERVQNLLRLTPCRCSLIHLQSSTVNSLEEDFTSLAA